MSPDPNHPHETCQEPAGLQHMGCTCVWLLPGLQSIPQTSRVSSFLPPQAPGFPLLHIFSKPTCRRVTAAPTHASVPQGRIQALIRGAWPICAVLRPVAMQSPWPRSWHEACRGEHQQETVVLLFACIAERRSRARCQAAAPLVMCLLLPLCFGAVNHSTRNQSCSD